MSKIESFKGKYVFLSSYYPAEVCLLFEPDVKYRSVEHAYQAAKSLDKDVRLKIRDTKSPSAVKKISELVELRKDWNDVKIPTMLSLLRQKFKHMDLKKLLIETGDAELLNGNAWGDTFWGTVDGIGENNLGKLLMQVRSELMTPRQDEILLENLKAKFPELQKLLDKVSSEWNYEDGIYRFYHHSFKVFRLQDLTVEIVNILRELNPIKGYKAKLNADFMRIYNEGTFRTFTNDDNQRWLNITRPIVEAFFHAKYFLEMAVKCSKELDGAPNMLPSGWAAFLYLYDMR